MKPMIYFFYSVAFFLTLSFTTYAAEPKGKDASGADLFNKHCAQCHDGSVSKAPSKALLQKIVPATIASVLNDGIMRPMAKHLSPVQRQAIANYLGKTTSSTPLLYCKKNPDWFDYKQLPLISGGGMSNLQNTRSIPQEIAGLPASDVKKLQLKWAFSFPDTFKARAQPAVAGGAVFIGSADGTVYALDGDSGCVHWVFKAPFEVRTAMTIDHWSKDSSRNVAQAPSIYFGDQSANAYAVNAVTGELRWKTKLEEAGGARITGSVVKYKDRLYIPVSGGGAGNIAHSCCTFRGSVSALNADTGQVIWKRYTIPVEPKQQYINAAGVPQYGPSGAGVWNTPTIDVKRQRLYVGTGENSSSPAVNGTSIIAMDLADGAIAWVMQASPGEAYNIACSKKFVPDDMNCPEEYKGRLGLDFAGGSPMLLPYKNGGDIIVAGQKTGAIFGLNPDRGGKILWRRSVSRGDYNWTNLFGMAVDGTTVFVTVVEQWADPFKGPYLGHDELGIHALDSLTGEWKWSIPVTRDCKEKHCRGYGAALTAIPGVVFAGAKDGYFRAFDTRSGAMLWDFNTAREFVTVNGSVANGGSIGGLGPVIANGNVYVNSGYVDSANVKAGNVLLVFSVEGK